MLNFLALQYSPLALDWILFIAAPFFVFFPYICNIIVATRISKYLKKHNQYLTWYWFNKYSTFFAFCVIVSGGCYASLTLICSRIFGLAIFDCGLTSTDLKEFQKIKIYWNVLCENVPQVITQITFLIYYNDSLTDYSSVILALITSSMSVLTSVLSAILNKQNIMCRQSFSLDIEFHKKSSKIDCISMHENSGYRLKLGRQLNIALGFITGSVEVLSIIENQVGCTIDIMCNVTDSCVLYEFCFVCEFLFS